MRSNVIAVSLAGLAVGWIAGLSVSPVVGAIIGALLGVGVAAVAALAGLQQPSSQSGSNPPTGRSSITKAVINPIPVAAFSVCVALGGSVALRARTAEWLTSQPGPIETAVNEWVKLGMKKDAVVIPYFQNWVEAQKNPSPVAPTIDHPVQSPTNRGLYDYIGVTPGAGRFTGLIYEKSPKNEFQSFFSSPLSKFCEAVPEPKQRSQIEDAMRGNKVSAAELLAKLSDDDLIAASKDLCKDSAVLEQPIQQFITK